MKEQNIFDNNNVTASSSQLAILKQSFPNCFDKNGNFIIDSFKEVIKDNSLDFSQESYSLNWLGKSYAQLLRNEKPYTFIKPDREHNDKKENKNSQNLLIKGDNLEVLKHLRNAYTEKIKMIYIDPPYNTGSDGFLYQDDRKFTKEELMQLAKVSEYEAQRILDFTSTGSNSHSAWLTFIYPRLYIARELLREDGVIFISIDDNEQAQLKILCDEIFGEENFIASVIVRSNPRGSQASKFIATEHEYIIMYSRNIELCDISGYKKDMENCTDYNLEDEHGKYRLLGLRQRGGAWRKEDRPDMHYPVYIDPNSGKVSLNKSEVFCQESIPQRPSGELGRWTWGKVKFIKEAKLLIGRPVNRKGKEDFWDVFRKDYLIKDGEIATTKPRSIFDEKEVNYQNGGDEIKSLFQNINVFNYPKPTFLLKKCIQMFSTQDNLILDFFAGSGTTAHAVIDLNAEDNGNRQFILVQLPEETDKKSEAYKAGYNTIFDITKARIEKVAEKIKQDNPEYEGDLGFKIFETSLLPDNYNSEVLELNTESQLEMFDGAKNDEQLLNAILTTWTLYDRIPLTSSLETLLIDDYIAQYSSEYNTLYLMRPNFTTENIKTLIEKIEVDDGFIPEKIVIYGFNFHSKIQRELDEALRSYQNKKSLNIDLIVRYY